jgi:lipopolysaccharide transport system permease protein
MRYRMATILAPFKRQYYLTIELAKREFSDRYAKQVLGALWAWLHPIVLMLLYTFVFHHIYGARFGEAVKLPRDFTTYVLSGLIPWLALQDILGRGSDAILDHASYVKQVAFPIEVLPVKRVLATLPILLTSTLFIVCYQLVAFHTLPLTVLLWPVFLLLFVVFACGIVYLLGSIGIFMRDLREIVAAFTAANLFLLPILFVPGQAPRFLEILFWFNPFSYVIWLHQDLLFYGRMEHPAAWFVVPILAVVVLALGLRTFGHLRSYFGEGI